MHKVSRREGFSDRNAIKPEKTEMQIDEFDKRTRIQLRNIIDKLFTDIFHDSDFYRRANNTQRFIKYILSDVYSEPVSFNYYESEIEFLKIVSDTILDDAYDDVLTLMEAMAQYWDDFLKKTKGYEYYSEYDKRYRQMSVFERINQVFEREYVAYRFIDSIIMPISDSFEKETIEEAITDQHKSVYEHISKASRLLSDRDNPDYENSIKESISAVEAICEILTGIKGSGATLSNMLKQLDNKGIVIHGGLKSAFTTLYGYTSDANGIRHAGDIGGASATFAEAKFMLVACCAFINYLKAVTAD